jgi:hypothetical protein
MTRFDKKPVRVGGLTGRPFASLALPGARSQGAVEFSEFRHHRTKKKSATRGLDNTPARAAAERIALAASATTRLTVGVHGAALRVQLEDVIVLLARDRNFAHCLFVPTFYVESLPDDGDHLSRILVVAGGVSSCVSIDDRLALLVPAT